MFQVLTAHGTDAKVWDSYIEMLPYDLRDVHFSSGWGRVQEVADPTAEAHIAILADHDRGEITLQPFVLRTIAGSNCFDMTAGGYGGIATSSALPAAEHGAALERELSAWREQHQVVAEFYLVNPVFAGHQLLLAHGAGGTFRPVKDVIVLHVGPEEELLAGMRATRRHAAAKAGGVRLHLMSGDEAQPESVAGLSELYASAMERKGAAERWRLRPEYFAALCSELGPQVMLIGAGEGALPKPDAAGVFTFGKSVAYYHLAATVENPHVGLADAVIATGAREANARGCDWLHLGGGVTSSKDDSLLAYKRSFGGLQRVVYAVQRVFNQGAYDDLCGDAGGASDAPGFFPVYRAKEAA